ncbi:MAG: tRNA uridine-5-carboxymethylaminomethyl(34) synthesis GTPase MnmE [Finegoldia sp.]|nr:tRNA uridine-5-carboxymethylaminomethyl(34) synthesis GTPase MnmE [Finegoldia sp.]
MDDCIAAISSAVGQAGIGIVRMSGEGSFDVLDRVFDKDISKIENKKMTYGHIIDRGNIIDEVMVSAMKEPYTYTREDVVEIYTHGGMMSVKKVLELLLRSGARLAEPGEFTKRAFLNGRLDLTQAEAVIDIIHAKTDKAHQLSVNQLSGSLKGLVKEYRDKLLDILSHVEYNINFTEDMQEEPDDSMLIVDAKEVRDKLSKLLSTANKGKILRDGVNTVIIGKPNVGKSSLLNALLKENRAIVTDVPGTTRDVIEEYIDLDGLALKISDTAGIRDTDDIVEKIGVEKSVSFIDNADLVIAIFDSSRELDKEDMRIIDLIKDKRAIILLNKSDLDKKLDFDLDLGDIPIIETSIKEGKGIEELEETILRLFNSGDLEVSNDVLVSNVRQQEILNRAYDSLNSAISDMERGVPSDCYEVDLRSAWEILGEITGETIEDDILDKIFSDFCIGK